jgi:hypothetical protein
MYEPPSPNELDPDRNNANYEIPESKDTVERAQAENLSTQNVLQHENKLKTLFLWLIGIGLGLGVILAIGVGFAMKKFGLTEKPDEREQPAQEQIQNDSLENLDIERQ